MERADRSGEDRFLGMEEAAGSIPARSIRLNSLVHIFVPDFRSEFFYLYTVM
jgi:hypothetical protein